jgi:ABC-2 type transport system ATP-binding protein
MRPDQDTAATGAGPVRSEHPMAVEAGGRAPSEHPMAVEARGLVKSFNSPAGVVRAVQGVDIAIARGETVALLGPNGAGKSTTIDMLLGLTEPDAGAASLFGRAPGEVVRAGWIGAMLQSGALINDLSVREILTMLASLYPAPLHVDAALEMTGVAELAERRTQTLSGGESQRVRFALALVSNPELLVLDEPTVGMDVEGRRAFWTTMRELAAGGKTVLFATHYLEEADAYADRAILVARGTVVASGATTEIKALVGNRTIRATLPHADLDTLGGLPGVISAERRGESVLLTCSDSDAAIRALLASEPDAHDIEIRGAGLEEAFLQLTGDGDHEREAELR